jgi:hypothetical protein
MIYLILFVVILGILLLKLFDLINAQFKTKKEPIVTVLPSKTDLTDIFKDITLQPYGCFTSLDEKFFLRKVNVYSKNNGLDSGIIISDTDTKNDTLELIEKVKNNGFDKYAYYIYNKYNDMPDGYNKNMSILELGVLGKLAGYNYLSIYKLNKNTRGHVYLTYSPPLNDDLEYNYTQADYNKVLSKSDLPGYTLTPKLNNYTNEEEKAPGKELSCGYPCLPYDKPLTFKENGVTKQYMCGSVGYPNIKTPSRFAVYRIVEKV